MPFVDKILGLLIGAGVCAIFGYVIYTLAKKQKEKTAEMVNSLTDENKEELMNASLNDCSLTKGLIGSEPKVGNSKTKLEVLFYDMYYPNSKKEFSLADVSVPTKQYNNHNLKKGDYVTIALDENGAKAILD